MKSTFLHLRFPFSFFLLPVFLFAVAVCGIDEKPLVLAVFLILHFLIYPASNGYNSFFDRDEGSIGGLKNPPPVNRKLYWTSLLLDFIALAWAAYFSITLSVMLLIYGLVSKAYSHPAIRLKKYPIYGWLAAGFFQGYFTFLAVVVGVQDVQIWDIPLQQHFAGALTSLLLFGSYPMTQIYQHEEDTRRGDRTLSAILGVLGTFHFTALFFTLSVGLFFTYFFIVEDVEVAFLFLASLIPLLFYFVVWYIQVRREDAKADYSHTMWLNSISASCLNLFFLYLILS